MKGSVNKGIFTYFMIFIGLLVGVILICFSIMMFNPGVSILGWEYINDKTIYKIETYNGADGSIIYDVDGNETSPSKNKAYIDFYNLNKLVIDANDCSINVVQSDFDQIIVNNKVKGIIKSKEVINFSIQKLYDQENKILTIKILDKNPKLVFSNTKSVDVHVSGNKGYSSLIFDFKTNKGNIDFGSKSLNDANNRVLYYNSVISETGEGKINISKNCKFLNSVSLKTKSGKISAYEDFAYANSNIDVVFETETGYIETQDISAKKINIIAKKESYVKLGNVNADIVLSLVNGDFRAKDINGNLEDVDDVVRNTNIATGNISGNLTIPNATKSNFSAGKITGDILLSTKSGDINIDEVLSKSEIKSDSGDIDILVGANNSGNITLTTNTGSINASFADVIGQNNITTTKGKINVIYQQDSKFKLIAKTKGKINLLSDYITRSNQEIIGYPTILDEEYETTNQLSLNSKSGNITVSR